MRIGFAGTPEFAATALRALHGSSYEVNAVLTQPDRPSGRGMKLSPSPVKQVALQHGIAVCQPQGLRIDGRYGDEAARALAWVDEQRLDVLVVAAYGLILPKALLERFPFGCINIHASLLPRWRGAAPIHRAIEAGDALTGITLMQMDEGLDTGPMLARGSVKIESSDTTGTLQDRLAALGGSMIVELMERLSSLSPGQNLPSEPQPSEGVTYAAKVSRQEARLDFAHDAQLLGRRVRAFQPQPSAWCMAGDEVLKIHEAEVVESRIGAAPGTVLRCSPDALVVACGQDALAIRMFQRPNGRRQAVSEAWGTLTHVHSLE